jgi:formylglycine-generating enzyme required for sulfatase activity
VALQMGQILNNRYRIVRLLGQGGFGAVYRAWDMNMDCPRALKENLDTSPEAQKQFKVEAQILGGLKHANLPLVIDHFILPSQGQYLVMEYVEGEDLQEKLNHNRGPLPESQVLPWIEQVCDALTYLHGQKPAIIHRDIKPANIKITKGGQAMLVDFGIAKVFDPVLSTTVGARAVTPGYSPHEQYGKGKTDARTDVYALGATLYTLLTGRGPEESIQRVITDTLIPPEQVNPRITSTTAAALHKALQMDPAKRYPEVAAFKNAVTSPPPLVSTLPLSQALPGPKSPTPLQTLSKPLARNWKTWVGIAGVVVVCMSLMGIVWGLVNGNDGGEAEATKTQTTEAFEGSQTAGVIAALPSDTPIPPRQPTNTPTESISPTPLPPSPTLTPSVTLTPALGPGSTQVSLKDGMVLVYIPEGEFEMGSEDGDDNEKPVHTVYLDAYWIDQTEVTNAMYQGCVAAGACDLPSNTDYYNNASYADHPVVYVSWFDAQAFCEWAGRRLPTEAEWEKAARGGLVGKEYPWGDEAPVCTPSAQNGAQYDPCEGGTLPVKTFAPNGYGLFDMAGNVWELVADWYQKDYYVNSPGNNPQGPSSGRYRVVRGGGWSYNDYLRVAYRYASSPVYSYYQIGFRCAGEPGL